MLRRSALLLAALALVVPHRAQAGFLTIEGLYGFARPPAANFSAAAQGTVDDQDLSDDTLQIAGGDILLNLGLLQFGAIGDVTIGDGVTQTALGALGGIRLGDKLRLDLLGEIGGHRFGNVVDDPDLVTASSSDQWLLYVGLRPGVAYRFGSGSSGIILGVWGFVRWDVTDESVPVTVDGASIGNVDLGGTTIGATLRLGLEL